jgi:hypothetical protein
VQEARCGARGVQYLQARRDTAFSWDLRWPFRRRGGRERRHLRVQTLRKEERREQYRDALKYHGLTQPNGGATPTARRIYLIYPSFLTILRYASYPIYRIGPNTPTQSRNIVSAHLSQISTIPYYLPFCVDTSPSVSEHHSCINFGGIGSIQRLFESRPAAELVSLPFDNFIVTSNGVFALNLFERHIRSYYETSLGDGYRDYDTYHRDKACRRSIVWHSNIRDGL